MEAATNNSHARTSLLFSEEPYIREEDRKLYGGLTPHSEPIHAFHHKSRLMFLAIFTSMGSAFFGYNQAIMGIVFEDISIPSD